MRACGPQQTISKMQQRRSTEGPRSWKITATVTQFCRGLDHVCLSDPHVFWAPWARIQSIHRQRGHHWTPYDTLRHLPVLTLCSALLSFAQCILCAVRKFCKLQVAAVRPLSPSTESSWKTTEETIVHICCWCNMAHARQTGLLQTAILVTF